MPTLYISATDLPGANLAPDTCLYAGRGWLALVREAMVIIGDSKIQAIREDSGALRVEVVYSTPEQRAALREIEQRSLQVCEICGAIGELRHDGLKNDRPAGWHRTRCEKHIKTRTNGATVAPPLLNQIADTSSGLFIHAPAGTAQAIAEVLRAVGRPVAMLTEADSMQLAIEQIADQLGTVPGHTLSATLEAASARLRAPIYLLVDRTERFEQSEIIYALKPARDALNTSALFGLRVAFVGADRDVQARMTRLPTAAFFCAQMVDASAEHLSVYPLQERERRRRTALRALSSFDFAVRRAALRELSAILQLDREHPIGEAAHLSTVEVQALVPVTVLEGYIPYVRDIDIAEPWATRFALASIGSTRQLNGSYVSDWHNFLSLWDQEHARLIDMLEDLDDV
ncbi:hypothetical protein [Pseudomonas aeruginosa]|uniref:hypothetical protein n=1 Tax=Pseudomonas aeruginosa TaxID=287 RepID=UPI0025B22CE2|nr:hypothetical protein [Pseudomonas aeruginosa]